MLLEICDICNGSLLQDGVVRVTHFDHYAVEAAVLSSQFTFLIEMKALPRQQRDGAVDK